MEGRWFPNHILTRARLRSWRRKEGLPYSERVKFAGSICVLARRPGLACLAAV